MKETLSHHLESGHRLAYAEYGNPDGFPLFFFHGWPSSRIQARILDSTAKDLGVRVISPDRPGFGQSDYQPQRTLLDWPDTIIQLADQLKLDTFSVVGNSGGGPYAAVCAYKIPEKLHKVGIVVGLAPTNVNGVLEGLGWLNALTWQGYHRIPGLIELSALGGYVRAKTFLSRFMDLQFSSTADQNQMTSQLRDQINQISREAFAQGKRGPAHDLKLYTSDWGFDLSKIKAEVFMWYGEDDKNVSVKMGEYYAAQIPDSHLTVYPNQGHFVILKHTRELLEALTI